MRHPNELDQQIENLRTLQQSYDQIATAAEAYNVGKTQLAQAITAKGVETSPTESYPEMAEKVNAISQETYEINGGEIYAKQLFGSLETPNYWNLYEVLANLLSDGRLINYGGILLAEYYKGYSSIVLSNVGAGGAYIVSDIDGNGDFTMYTEDITHTWNDFDNGKGNRWVAYCFVNEGHDFEITNTGLSPRKIFIGRNVGDIKYLTTGRTADIVVPDGNKLHSVILNGNALNLSDRFVLRNLINFPEGIINDNNIESVYIQADNMGEITVVGSITSPTKLSSIILSCKNISTSNNYASIFKEHYNGNMQSIGYLCICDVESCIGKLYLGRRNNDYIGADMRNLQTIDIINTEQLTFDLTHGGTLNASGLKCINIGYKTNDRTKWIVITGTYTDLTFVKNIVLKDGWCKPLNISKCTYLTEDGITNNITENILKKLKQDEADCGDGITITLGATNLAKLTSAESVQLLDDLTNIYGYTFA